MQVKFDDTERKDQNPSFVYLDRKRTNEENIVLHSAMDLALQKELEAKVRDAYFRSRIFVDANKKTLVVKVYKPTLADKISSAVHTLNASLDPAKFKMTLNKKGDITYHIMK